MRQEASGACGVTFVAAWGLWPTVHQTEMGDVRVDGMPVHLSETDWKVERGAPCLGEHNDYVFGELLGRSVTLLRLLAQRLQQDTVEIASEPALQGAGILAAVAAHRFRGEGHPGAVRRADALFHQRDHARRLLGILLGDRVEELHHAQEEGIEFHWLTAPVEILDDGEGNVRAMRCVRMELGEPDDSGRRSPVPVEGSEYEFETDMVVYAIGTNPNPILGQTSRLKLNKWGYIETDEDLATSMAGVYAGGDIVTGAATVILAMGAGRKAARSIKDYLVIRDSESIYQPQPTGTDGTLFGIDLAERNFARLRLE